MSTSALAPFATHGEGITYVILPRSSALGSVDVGIDANLVARVVPEEEWDGAPPVDAMIALGLPAAADVPPHRVLVIQTGTRNLAVRTSGKLIMRTIDRRLVQPLPQLVMRGAASRVLQGIVLADGETPLLVLDAAALAPARGPGQGKGATP